MSYIVQIYGTHGYIEIDTHQVTNKLNRSITVSKKKNSIMVLHGGTKTHDDSGTIDK